MVVYTVSLDVNDLEALTPNHFLLGNKTVCLPNARKNLLIIGSSLSVLKPIQISFGTDFVRNICQLYITGKKEIDGDRNT